MFKKIVSVRVTHSLVPWLIPTAVLLTWLAVSHSGWVPAYQLPHPMDVLAVGSDYLFGSPGTTPYASRFWGDLTSSLKRVLMGFSLAALSGVPLGLMSGRITGVNLLISNSINGLRSVPGISWLPLALVWFGIGLKTTLFLVSLAAFFPIYINAAAGARQINLIYYQAGAMMGIGRLRGVFAILLPATMPQITTGLRLGMGISWAYLVLGELTGVPDGLGALIMDARMQGRIDVIVLGIVLIALIGRLSDLILLNLIRICSKSARRLA